MRNFIIILFLSFVFGNIPLLAEGEEKPSSATVMNVLVEMQKLLDNVYGYYQEVPKLNQKKLIEMEKRIAKTDMRWDGFYSENEGIIVKDSLLLNIAGEYQTLRQGLTDTLVSIKHYFSSLEDFEKAEKIVDESRPIYEDYLKKATQLSMVQKLAPLLEKLKKEEQGRFAKIQAKYDVAKTASDEFPELATRMGALEEKFVDLQIKSGKIQEAAYVPLFDRVKNWFMGLACVSMILMYITTLKTKLDQAKQQKENMKKMKEMMNKDSNSECPTI